MGDHDDGPCLPVTGGVHQVPQDTEQFAPRREVERPGRLVGEEDGRAGHQRAGDGTAREEHFGTGGLIEVLKFPDGTAVGRSEGAFSGRPVSDPKQLRILELRYGMIRAQALTPRESRAVIEQMLGES
ncbi:hypothetical protein SVIOM342S_05695 [Streptomyces violaceorubidus]